MKSSQQSSKERRQQLEHGYALLLERAVEIFEDLEKKGAPVIHHLLDTAKDRAVELEELTIEEAEQIKEYITHDLHDAARHLIEEERELADWLRLDLLLIEQRLLHNFSTLVELAHLELKHLMKDPQHALEWHTGEIVSIGTLACDSCDKQIHFYKPGHIPPCPGCHGTRFHRAHM